jgi:hypothetical protein
MSRVLLILMLVAGVASADAPPPDSERIGEPTKKRRKKKKREENRTPTKSTKPNMPRGFVWPPTKAMETAADACQLQLDELGVAYQPAKEIGRVVRPVTIDGHIGGVTFAPIYGKNHVFDCQLVLTLAGIAPKLLELGVREVRFGSAFRNTKVRVAGRTKNILSRHALGIALDVYAFIDAEGRESNVHKHYKRGNQLLRDVENAINSSGMFRIVLTPRNDPKSHYDHFHIEANPDYTERVAEGPAS